MLLDNKWLSIFLNLNNDFNCDTQLKLYKIIFQIALSYLKIKKILCIEFFYFCSNLLLVLFIYVLYYLYYYLLYI